MTHDSRRYHRTRRPPFARGYGLLGTIGGGVADAAGTAGSALGSAAGAVGSGLESAASSIGSGLESAFTAPAAGATPTIGQVAGGLVNKLAGGAPAGVYHGLESVGQGLQSLFGAGGEPSEAGRLAGLGQAVPAGVDLAGPSPTFTGPGFLESVHQGFIQGPAFLKQYADPSGGTKAGAGIGQLLDAIQQMQAQGGGPAKMPPIIQTGGPIRPMQVIPPANTGTVGSGPILGGLLGHL